MANYEILKSAIQQVVKKNGNNEIKGALLQQSLLAMINSLGSGYQFVGVATPATNPGTPDQKVFYIASTAGTYTNMDSIVLSESEIAIIVYDSSWQKKTIDNKLDFFLGINSIEQLTPTVIPGNYYINKYGIKSSAGSNAMRLTNPIPLQKNDAIFVRASTLNEAVSVISVTDENATKYEPVVIGLANNRTGNFAYVAPDDCYIVLSYYNTIDKCIKVPALSLLSAMPPLSTQQKDIKNNVDSIASLDSFNWLNINDSPSISGKIAINRMVKMAYFVPNPGYENHDIAILALSCYRNVSSATPDPTRLDIWLTDATDNDISGQQGIIAQYIKSVVEDSDFVGYKKIILTFTAGKAYLLVNWDLVRQYKDSTGNYRYVYWGEGWRNKPKLWNVNADDPRIIGFEESNTLIGKNMGVDGDSITEGNQWSYYASQKLGMGQFNVGVGSACWSYKQYYALDGSTLLTPQKYTDSGFAGFGGSSDLTTDINRQKWVNNNACTHIERFVAEVSAGNYPIPDVFVFAMGTNQDTGNGNSDGSVDEAMQATSISDADFVNAQGKSLKYTMCGAMRWCIETIKRQYPNCRVFVSLPIQRAVYSTNKTYLYPKIQLIKEMAIQMGCQIIDQYNGCGITAAIENDASPFGPYLRDGLHPNTDGQKLMGYYAAKQIENNMF